MRWLIEADRTLGSSHAEQSLPCQDNICHLSKGNWHSICISDGAGSSKFSEISSKFVSERFAQSLLLLADLIEATGPGSWINDHIINDVLELRKGLKEHTDLPELDDYHCTLVAILVSESIAIAVHIGDGAIIAGKCGEPFGSSSFINGTLIASLPENGDYKNETFFITEPHWLKHFRIKVLGKVDWFVMGSDGGIDILSDRQKVDGPLVAALINNLSSSHDKESSVFQLINSEFAGGKTTDDISLAIGWLGPPDVRSDLVWDEALSKSLYLDPAADVSNHNANAVHRTSTASVLPNDKFRIGCFSVILNILLHNQFVKFSMVLGLSVLLIFCVYVYSTDEDISILSKEHGTASNLQAEEDEFFDTDPSDGAGLMDERVEKGFGDNQQLPLETPQNLPETQELPSLTIWDRLKRILSAVTQNDATKDPPIDKIAPNAAEPLEL